MKQAFTILFILSMVTAQSQLADTLVGNIDETVVTATRTERKIKNVAVPVIVVSQKQIQQSGSLRLNDILQEQTGLFITGGTGSGAVGGGIFGNGIQLQGLSPDYTMILLDGEPLIGRQGGVMDLSRFAVGNIKKIEIVKGPASSLYGSEAMGGVINLITAPLINNETKLGLRYGSFNTVDAFISGNQKINNKLSAYYFLNRNSTNGYDLDQTTPEKTLDALYNYTAQLKLQYKFSASTQLIINNRYFYNWQNSNYAINSNAINIGGGALQKDYTINPVLLHSFNDKIKNRTSVLVSGYTYNQQLDSLKNGTSYYRDAFNHQFNRLENITDISFKKSVLSVGVGATIQTVNTTRYREIKTQYIYHAFVQNDWKPIEKLSIIAGIRYDNNTDYRSRVSPKIAAKYTINSKLSATASFGYGFKAPDFRQLYLNFTNAAGDGYTLLGASEFSLAVLQQQQQQGLIATILPSANAITTLQPEISTGINIGVQYVASENFTVDVNVFRNDIDNLINFITVANRTNGAAVFSYVNINRAFTQGLEFNASYKPTKQLQISGGYQFLETGDKDIVNAIRNNTVFGRNQTTNTARLMTMEDYGGLLNRSNHMANLRLFYSNEKKGFSASIRAIYRGRWGVTDVDGNGFANRNDEYAPALLQMNATASKQINKQWQLQLGINNILNETNAKYLPNTPERNYFIVIQYSIIKNKK